MFGGWGLKMTFTTSLLFLEGPGRYVKEVEGRTNLRWMAEDNRRAIAATEVLVREHEKCMIWEKMGRLGWCRR